MRGRELKHSGKVSPAEKMESPLMRGRELKQSIIALGRITITVAPYAGA